MQFNLQFQNDQFNNRYNQNYNYNNDPSCSIEISYDNWYQNKYHDEIRKAQYGNDLRRQIEENEMRKRLEKKRKEEEDLKEELRLQKEREILNEKARIEEQKRKEELLARKNENERIMNSYSVMSKPRSTKPKNRIIILDKPQTYTKSYGQILLEERQNSLNQFNNDMLNTINKMSNEYNKNISRLNNELNKMKSENNIFHNDLGKGINDLNEAFKMKQQQENAQKYYFYKLYVDKNMKRQDLNEYIKIGSVPYFERKDIDYKDYKLPPILLDHNISYNNYNSVRPLKTYGWYF